MMDDYAGKDRAESRDDVRYSQSPRSGAGGAMIDDRYFAGSPRSTIDDLRSEVTHSARSSLYYTRDGDELYQTVYSTRDGDENTVYSTRDDDTRDADADADDDQTDYSQSVRNAAFRKTYATNNTLLSDGTDLRRNLIKQSRSSMQSQFCDLVIYLIAAVKKKKNNLLVFYFVCVYVCMCVGGGARGGIVWRRGQGGRRENLFFPPSSS